MIISINGKIVSEKKACLPVLSKSFLYGFAVFETMRTYNKKVFRLVDHIKRLFESVNILDIKPIWNPKKVCRAVDDLVYKSKYPESRIRVILTQEHLIITIEELKEKPAVFYKTGLKLASYPGRRSIPHAKVLGDTICYLANQYATRHNLFYDSILIDPDTSYVGECSYANIFWVFFQEVCDKRKGCETLFPSAGNTNTLYPFKSSKLSSRFKAAFATSISKNSG